MRDPFLLEWVSFSSYSEREPQRKREIVSVFSLSAEEKKTARSSCIDFLAVVVKVYAKILMQFATLQRFTSACGISPCHCPSGFSG